jgi:gliding motility-associated-like protein
MNLNRLLVVFFIIMGQYARAQDPCDPPIVASLASSGPVCSGEFVTLTFALPDGDVYDVTYSINGNIFNLTGVANGVTAQHVVTISTNAVLLQVVNDDDDDDSCFTDFNFSISITVSNPIVSISNQNNPACGQNNGSITASASGGTTPYQFSLNGGTFQNSASFGGLSTGNYTVVAQDAAGCTADISTDLNSAGTPTVSISSQNDPACGQNNGSITASASGGTAPYQFNLNGGIFQNSPSFGGLSAGNYTVVVQDAAGCTADISTDLNSEGGPTVSISSQNDPSCGQNNGSITASATGGTAPYQFNLNGGIFQNSASFGGLSAGNYTVVARDAAGCTADISTDLNSAGGPTVSISNQNNPACGQNNGSITASASGGTAPYQFSLNGGTFQNSASFGGLSAGNYTVRTRDALGCESSNFATTLTNPSDNLPQASILFSENQGCTSTTFVLKGNLPIGSTGTWDCDEITPATPNDPIWNVSNVPVGTTLITWTLSAPGCPNYDVAEIILSILPPPTANFDGIINVLTDQQPQVSVLDNDVAYASVSLQILKNTQKGIASLDNDNNINYQPYSTADGLDTLLYEICYTNCTDVCDTALVLFRNIRSEDPCFFLGDTSNVFTNGLTPNGDDKNDVLIFRLVSEDECQLNHAESEIIIYNRWGDVVFEESPYKNKWGGKRRKRNGEDGDLLPQGVYYFVLRIVLDDKEYTQFGSVILIY